MTYNTGKDGIVEGTDKDDVIDTGYNGDPEGDMIDANDAVLGDVGSNDDIVYAYEGDDKVSAGQGNDTVYGEKGDDTLDGDVGNDLLDGGDDHDLIRGGEGDDTLVGGKGDDTLLGDAAGDAESTLGARALFDWERAPNFGDEKHAGGFTQDTGEVNVTFSINKVADADGDARNTFETNTQNTDDLDAVVSENSSFESQLRDNGDRYTYDFSFDAAVADVEFRVNDIDGGGRVTILAEGPDGPVAVTLDPGSKLTQSGQTVTSEGDYKADDSDYYSVLVNIEGPVSKITVIHEQIDSNSSGVNITDIAFNSILEVDPPVEGAGDDVLIGGEGDDLIDGGAGNDLGYGGDGDDTLIGGTGDDTLLGDAVGEGAPILGDRALFDWEKAPGFGNDQPAGGFTQDTGDVDVTFSMTKLDDGDNDVLNTYETNTQNTKDLDSAVSEKSSFESDLQDRGDTYQYDFTFDAAVADVEFRVNDIDGGGRVTIRAEGPDGPVEVTLDPGGKLTQDGPSVTSEGGYESDDSDYYSVLVNIEGPVTKVTVIHEQINDADTGVNITDIAFNPVIGTLPPGEGSGKDYIDGGEGDDVIDGGAKEDTLIGGDGDDTIHGGDYDDLIYGDAGGSTTVGSGSDLCDAEGGKPTSLTFQYNGPSNTVTGGFTDDKHKIQDFTADDSDDVGYVVVTDKDDNVLFEGPVTEGDSFTVNAGGGSFDSETFFSFYDQAGGTLLQYANIHTSCSAPLVLGDQAGPVTLTGATLEDGSTYASEPTDPGDVAIGDDLISGDDGKDTIFGQGGDDTIDGGEDDDIIDGGDGRDVLDGGAGDGKDSIFGGAGQDTILGGTDEDTIDGGAGGFSTDPLVNTDSDTLDLSGVGNFQIINERPDGNGNGFDGTVVLLDDDGDETGRFDFFEIENFIGRDLAPNAENDTAITDEDTPVTNIDVLANDSDPDGLDSELTVIDATALNGSVTINPDGTLDYTPDPDFFGEDTITYTIEDRDGLTDTATVAVTVNPVNDAPTANDDVASTDEDTPAENIDVLSNDTDPDLPDDTLTVIDATADNGTVTINPDGTLNYTPDPDFFGEDTITYTIVDEGGVTDTATVTVTVNPVDDAPVARDDSAETDEDTPVTVDVLANDSDPDTPIPDLTVTDATALNGTVTINPDGTLSYTPNPDFNGDDEITYTVSDPEGNSDTATVTVTVNPVDDAPVAQDDTAETDEEQPVIIDLVGNDTDVDDPTSDLVLVSFEQPTNGTVVDNGDGTVTYTPNPGYSGTESFDYVVGDPDGLTDTGTATVTVNDTILPDGIVQGDEDANLIDFTYTGDPEGDLIDRPDQIIVGGAPIGTDGDVVEAGGGDDTVRSLEGDDTVSAGMGNDLVEAGNGNDSVDGGDGDDTLRGQAGDDTLSGGVGNDELDGGSGDDFLSGGAGDDTISGNAGDDVLAGGADDDSITGGAGSDEVDGGTGNDFIDTSGPNAAIDADVPLVPTPFDQDPDPNNDRDTVFGGAGNDTILTGDDADSIEGGFGDDSIESGIDDDTVIGGAGNDTIIDVQGSDSIFGNDGDDLIDAGTDTFSDYPNDQPFLADGTTPNPFFGAGDPNPDDGRDFVDGGDGNDTITTGDDDDTIIGGGGDDDINAGIDDDSVVGGAGNDFIVGSHGSDTLDGNAGNDTIYGGYGPTPVPPGIEGNEPDATDPQPDNGRDLIRGGDGDDVLFGEDDDDTIIGGAGNDIIDGGNDDDSLGGNDGVDILLGEDGDDTISGGNDTDLVLGGTGQDEITGDGGDDLILGGDGDDTVDGGEGTDFILGGDGDDELSGGAGSDLVEGNEGNDLIYGDGATNEGNISTGDADILLGEDGDDTIYGGAGADIIDGAAGADELYGGDDEDTFIEVGPGDVIDGGEGTTLGEDFDTIIVAGPSLVEYDPDDPEAGTITFYDLDDGSVTGTATFTNIERVIQTNRDGPFESDDDLPDSTDPDDVFVPSPFPAPPPGASSDGIVRGTDGNDSIVAGGFVDNDGDEIDNGDAIIGNDAPDDDRVIAGDGDDTVRAGIGDDFVDGGNGRDILFGDTGDDTLSGGESDDALFGGEGDDELAGEEGDDILFGNEGEDALEGGEGNDQLDGGADNDHIYGDEGADTLSGGDGNDLLDGGDGADEIATGSGNDIVSGGADADTITSVNGGDTVRGGSTGDDQDVLDLRGSLNGGSYEFVPGSVVTDSDGNGQDGQIEFFDAAGDSTGTLTFENIERIIPCFTPGTLIATPKGERRVEDLREGDRVITRDNGIQEVRWIGEKRLNRNELLGQPELKPVLIQAGSLGNGLPERDMLVSPNHRMLVANDKTALYFEEREVLVAAKHLVDGDGVDQVEALGVSYIHFMFEQHEVVLSDGTWSESFQPGDYTLKGIGDAQRAEILKLFPELEHHEGIEGYQSARRTLKRHEAKLLLK